VNSSFITDHSEIRDLPADTPSASSAAMIGSSQP